MNCSGWAPPRVLGDFYRRDILYGNAGPTGINRRTETRASEREEKRERERERETGVTPPLPSSSIWGMGAGVDLPPSWFIAQSALTANGFVFAGPDACLRTLDTH